jgi:hypothetical protein
MRKFIFIIVGYILFGRQTVNAMDLFEATESGNVDQVSILLGNPAIDVNQKDKLFNSPLHVATVYNKEQIILLFLAHNADINTKNSQGETPLHLAADCGHESIVRLLLNNNALVNPQNNDGETPLRVAIRWSNKVIIQLLLEGSTDVDLNLLQKTNPKTIPLLEKELRCRHLKKAANFTLCTATHPRLGICSPANTLTELTLTIIFSHLKPSDYKECKR